MRRLVRILGRDAVLAGRQRDTANLERGHEGGAHARRLEEALDLAVAHSGLLELEDLVGQDVVILDAVDLGDADDLARAVAESGRMDDDIDRGGDLLADGSHG